MARRIIIAALAVVLVAMVGGCGQGDDDDEGPEVSQSGTKDPVDARLDVDVEPRDAGFKLTWEVTNTDDRELVVFDGRWTDPDGGEKFSDVYVVGRDDDTVEVSRRLFPVPSDLEGAQQRTMSANVLAPQATARGEEVVLSPFEYHPAASQAGGDELPDDPKRVVFCVGVAAAEHFPASPGEAESVRSVQHTADNAAFQTLLCSDPFDL